MASSVKPGHGGHGGRRDGAGRRKTVGKEDLRALFRKKKAEYAVSVGKSFAAVAPVRGPEGEASGVPGLCPHGYDLQDGSDFYARTSSCKVCARILWKIWIEEIDARLAM